MGAWVFLVLAAAASGWRTVDTDRGLVVQVRPVEGSALSEIRILSSTEAPPSAVCRTAFGDGSLDRDDGVPIVERRTLSETPTERVSYERVRHRLTEDRDYAVRYRLVEDPGGGCAVQFKVVDVLGPPSEGVIRITRLTGQWRSAPRPGGGSDITYQIWSEPGGSPPAFLVERAQRQIAARLVRKVLEKATNR